MKITKHLLLGLALLLTGCQVKEAEDPGPQTVKLATLDGVGREQKTRFSVEKIASFYAGYDNAQRDIFIVHDSVTGQSFFGITDCTLIKIANKKRADAADTASDIITTAISSGE